MRPQINIDLLKRQSRLLLTLIGLVLISTAAAWCQLPDNLVTVSHPGGLTRLDVEYPALMMSGTNAWIYSPAGRFQLRTGSSAPLGGDPTRVGDENLVLASVAQTGQYGLGFSSHTTIAVNPQQAFADADDQGLFYEINALMQQERTATDPALLTNYWLTPPVAGSRDIVGSYRLPVIFDSQDDPTEYIEVRQTLTLIGDALQVENLVYNTSSQSQRIGVRVLFDGTFGGTNAQDGRPIVLPDGTTITRETVLPDQSSGIGSPATWVTYDDPVAPRLAIRGVLSNNEILQSGVASKTAGAPDSVMWGQQRNMGMAGQYYFTPNRQAPIVGEDWAYAVRWEPVHLLPGESCRFLTYYGVGSSTPDYDRPYALMVYTPHSLVVQSGDDPLTPDVVEDYYLTDPQGRSSFPIYAYIDNFGADTLLDASVRLRLPAGLELVEGETLTKSAGVVARNEMKWVSWQVRAVAARPGAYTVRFTGPRGKVLERTINIPAMPVLSPVISPRGLEMVSIPYQFQNDDVEWIFQDLGSLQPGGNATVVRWDPRAGQYRWFPDPLTTSLQPGVGFWLLNRARDTVRLPLDAAPVNPEHTFSIKLEPGWNQIGNPFTVPIRLDQVRVLGSAGTEMSMEDAYSRLLLIPTVFEYDPLANDYVWNTELQTGQLDPFKGYWLLCLEAITLQFPAPSASITTGNAPANMIARKDASEGWAVDLTISGAGQVRSNRVFGCRPGAVAGFDQFDLLQPPPVTAGNDRAVLQAAFVGDEGIPMLVDTRPLDVRSRWQLAVSTASADEDITISWGDLSRLADDVVLTLVDTVSGKRCYMRTATSYSYRSRGANQSHRFEIIAQPRAEAGILAVTSLDARQTAGGQVAITCSLTAPASLDIMIRNIAGMPIAMVVDDQIVDAGVSTVVWNGITRQGTSAPQGRYICQVTARCPDTGQMTNSLSTFAINR